MCNLYALRAPRDEMNRKFSLSLRDNLELPGIFPDARAPVVVETNGVRSLAPMRWGLPPWKGERGITNVRNLASPYWRRWLGAEHRCLVPATSFCEWADTKPKKTPTWFALGETRPLFAFAGLYVGEGDDARFGFLTRDANAVVAPVHPKAMPVMLCTEEDAAAWLAGSDALMVQDSADAPGLAVVATGERRD